MPKPTDAEHKARIQEIIDMPGKLIGSSIVDCNETILMLKNVPTDQFEEFQEQAESAIDVAIAALKASVQ